MKYIRIIFAFLLILFITSCNYFSFTPRSKNNKSKEEPSILIFDRIVDFRIEQMGWPVSKTDFISKGKKYEEVFKDFSYQYTTFTIIDSNRMNFSFSEHIKDIREYEKTNKSELNQYRGTARFFKENGKFIWKLKMN